MQAVSIHNVHKRYANVQALRGVSFNIEQGEFFGLLGPNGAGKTTLISCLAGLSQASTGELTVMGHDVQRDFRSARRNIGVVPQEVVFDPFFTVREMLHLQAGYFGCRKQAADWIEELLDALDLTAKADASLRSLSGGMKRRLLIAQALVHRPPVVVLDEPTAGVDVELRRALWKFTKRLHREGHTIVLTTHYLEEAEALCNRIAILRQGELIALETKEQLLGRSKTQHLQLELLGDAALPSALQSLQVEGDAPSLSQEGRWVTLALPEPAAITAVLDSLRSAGLAVNHIRTKQPGLEAVFLELTGGQA